MGYTVQRHQSTFSGNNCRVDVLPISSLNTARTILYTIRNLSAARYCAKYSSDTKDGAMKRKISPHIERDCQGSLSSPLWSELPPELLAQIVTQTTDTETLDRWCKATRGSHYLHETAMTARWRTITIDDRDLLPAPGDDEYEFNQTQKRLQRHKLGQHWKPAGEMVNTLLGTIDESGCCPANYLRDLVFDFRLLRYWVDDIQAFWEEMSGDSEDSENSEDTEPPILDARDLVPTVESVRHTLTLLKGNFHNLRYLSCYGDTPQVILDSVASQDATKIHSLEMRSLGAYIRLQIKVKRRATFSKVSPKTLAPSVGRIINTTPTQKPGHSSIVEP